MKQERGLSGAIDASVAGSRAGPRSSRRCGTTTHFRGSASAGRSFRGSSGFAPTAQSVRSASSRISAHSTPTRTWPRSPWGSRCASRRRSRAALPARSGASPGSSTRAGKPGSDRRRSVLERVPAGARACGRGRCARDRKRLAGDCLRRGLERASAGCSACRRAGRICRRRRRGTRPPGPVLGEGCPGSARGRNLRGRPGPRDGSGGRGARWRRARGRRDIPRAPRPALAGRNQFGARGPALSPAIAFLAVAALLGAIFHLSHGALP